MEPPAIHPLCVYPCPLVLRFCKKARGACLGSAGGGGATGAASASSSAGAAVVGRGGTSTSHNGWSGAFIRCRRALRRGPIAFRDHYDHSLDKVMKRVPAHVGEELFL